MEQATSTILEQGVLGAIIVALAIAVIMLWRENQKLHEKLYKEAKETATASISAQNSVANSISNLADKIEASRRDR